MESAQHEFVSLRQAKEKEAEEAAIDRSFGRKKMQLKLEQGRPEDFENRIEKEQRVYKILDQLGMQYARVDHEAAMNMEDCEEIDKILGAKTCKNLFLCNRQKTNFYLLLIPGDKAFKTKDLSAQIGSARLSFGSAEDMEALLGVTPGSVTILGLMNDTDHRVKLLVDQEVLQEEFFGCHPCINTTSLRLETKEVFDTFLKAVAHDMMTVRL